MGRAADRSEAAAERLSREVDPALAAQDAELLERLVELVELLPPSQREALDLWAEGFRYAEIASILGRQEGHVRVLVHRGLKTLREHPQVRAQMNDEPVGNALRGVP
jgi:RNA polymerase sigma factor (sigma-70 family)